jgi:hypothetical protein
VSIFGAGNCAAGEGQLSVVLSSPGATQIRFDIANAMGGAASVIAGVFGMIPGCSVRSRRS